LIQRAVGINPDNAAAYSNLGLALRKLDKLDEAIASYGRALALQPDNLQALNNRGSALRDLKRYHDALQSYDRALSIQPDYLDALKNRGALLLDLGRYDDALLSYDRALAIQPDDTEALYGGGNALVALKRPSEAIANYDQALSLKPDFFPALNNRGSALLDLNRLEEALASFDGALALAPDNAEALNNRGNALVELNRHQEALASFDRALSLEPDHADAHYNGSLCRLLLGDFENGWRKYESRWRTDAFKNARRDFTQPLWRGEQAIAGQTLLLHAEQGLGDTLQFCRYAKLAAARGATVLIEVQLPLKSLLAGLDGVSSVLSQGETPPSFDYHAPLLSLPRAFETRLDGIPAAIPYLHADPIRVGEWQAELGDKALPRVGLAWSGSAEHKSDQKRSIPLTRMAKLVSGEAQFVSLQKELHPADRVTLSERDDIRHFGDQLHDFADTAALIEALDLVISADTAVAHLAGALGKEVWILLPFSPDWRWLLERDDSPWYPTARLFRQRAEGDWDGVIQRVASQLKERGRSSRRN
jgi:tetratricopeptide (TPR) repeat protein